MYNLINSIKDPATQNNLINAASYLMDNLMEITEQRLLYYANPENYKEIEKSVRSVKKLRKHTNVSIVNFYKAQ